MHWQGAAYYVCPPNIKSFRATPSTALRRSCLTMEMNRPHKCSLFLALHCAQEGSPSTTRVLVSGRKRESDNLDELKGVLVAANLCVENTSLKHLITNRDDKECGCRRLQRLLLLAPFRRDEGTSSPVFRFDLLLFNRRVWETLERPQGDSAFIQHCMLGKRGECMTYRR